MLRVFALIVALGLACLAAVSGVWAADLLRVDGSVVKWPAPSTGTTTVITYAVLGTPYLVAGRAKTLSVENCGAMQPFSEILANSADLSVASSGRELRLALAAWETVADIKFVEVSEPNLAHIVVGATEMPTGRAFANLILRDRGGSQQSADMALGGANEDPSTKSPVSSKEKHVALIERAFVCLNPKVRWKVGFDGNLSIYDLRYAFMHEIGHAIGLDHPGRSGSVMGFRYDESISALQASDISAVQSLYGPAKKDPELSR